MLAGGICLSPQRGGRGLWVWLTAAWPREWQNQLTLNGGVTPALTRVTRHWKENGFWTRSIIAAFLEHACSYQCTSGIHAKNNLFFFFIVFIEIRKQAVYFEITCFWLFHIFWSGHAVSNTPRQERFIERVSGVIAPGVRLSGASKASGCAENISSSYSIDHGSVTKKSVHHNEKNKSS